ncbi:hypothetical protein [Roseobacter sp. OBYS 0001]|uniref:hypothetical protein n=1 Tax=Roseobacter sp. OBYS 0001 TaxID=882651 RepID=UPI001BC6C2A7|nr:hypothetical protein [Roseobacter sp. OBYS 0001]GIT88483.1 hypothetical protein ROBYS_34990 [Roseobacter sp. OBYS 0001]
MTEIQIDSEAQIARTRVSEAVQRVWAKRMDLGAMIAQGYRELAARESKEDPAMSWCRLELALHAAKEDPDTPEAIEAHLELVRAIMFVWYKVPSDLSSMVMRAAEELAILEDRNPDDALMSAILLMQNARGAGEAFSEQYEANKAKADERRRAKGERERQRLTSRLQRERPLAC